MLARSANGPPDDHAKPPPASRRDRFVASYFWLILKNALGWLLILAAFVAGPLVPGPGGIPLFLIGFALISFPGKRRLTARVLRGRPFHFQGRSFPISSTIVALIASSLAIILLTRSNRLIAPEQRSFGIMLALYACGVAFFWLLARSTPYVLNATLRLIARARRKFRPWLRRHHIRLLPPRWRRRHAHEPGHGAFRLADEILKFHRRR